MARIRLDTGSRLANPRLIPSQSVSMQSHQMSTRKKKRQRATDLLEGNGDILVELGFQHSHALWLWRELRDRHAGQAAQQHSSR